ncbi:Serine/threonine-protein phosphatase Pgam5, mitochondrial, partial [Stegodyphus mimosarum]
MRVNFSKMYCSCLPRTQQTANIIESFLGKVPVEVSDLLDGGIPVAPDPPLPLFQYDPEVCATQKKRLDQAFQKIFHRPSIVASSHNYEIIISHSTVIRYFICKLLQIDPATWERFFVPHCSISWVKILGNGVISIKSVG